MLLKNSLIVKVKITLTLSVTLGKLDFNLPATNPLPVQAVQSIFCVAHILKYAGWLRVLIALTLIDHTNFNKCYIFFLARGKTKTKKLPTHIIVHSMFPFFSFSSLAYRLHLKLITRGTQSVLQIGLSIYKA